MFLNELTSFRNMSIFLVSEAMFVSSCIAQQVNPLPATELDSLRAYLQDSVTYRNETLDKSRRYSHALADLNDDAVQEVIVYLTGAATCGTGGCTLLILKRDGSSFTLVTRIPATRPPIRVLPGKNHGWHDISIWGQGGGDLIGHTDVFSFDGTAYAFNPATTPPQLTEEAIKVIPELPLDKYGVKLFD